MHKMNLPEHWKVTKLGAVAEIIKGGTPSRSVDKYFQGDIAWAIPSDITALDSALYIHDTGSHISEEGLSKSAAKLLPSGTVLLTSRATIGETAISTTPMATNQGFSNFICNNEILNVYLAYYLRHIKQKLNVLASGSTFKEVTKGTLLNVEIPLPPLPEQRAIAAALQTIQETKFTRQHEIALERERKAALMDHLFSHGTKGEPRKQTEIGEIPESWEVLPFKKIMLTGTQNGIYKSKDYYGKGSLIADMKDIFKEGDILKIQEMDRVNLDSNELEKFSLHRGDLVFARRSFKPGGAGKCQHVPPLDESVVFSSSLIRVSLKQSINSEFYAYFLNSKSGRRLIDRIVRVLAVSGVSGSDLKNLLIPVLSTESEQITIAETLRTFDTKITALEQEAAHLDELFHAMLDELMTGQRSTVPLIDTEMDV